VRGTLRRREHTLQKIDQKEKSVQIIFHACMDDELINRETSKLFFMHDE
jgi:hypothetical protein